MKKTAKAASLILVGAMMMSLTACGSKPAETTKAPETTTAEAASSAADTEAEETTAEAAKTDDGKQFKIGVLQLVQHSALDAANK